ncbi:prolyl oligopeptidase family serine peptidase [Candidatus Bipolaricaulota bacterium]|nr:prolyl oligopeptidase family serine peptidase [Candidatus Bipolaricaulota bacterium]
MIPVIILLSLLGTGRALYNIGETINGQVYDTPRGEVGTVNPGDWDLPFEDVEFKTSDDLTVKGWYVDNEGSTRAVILAPGKGANRWDILRAAPVIRLYENNFDVLLFDPRSTGESDGDRYGFGYFESQDIANAVEFLKEEKDVTSVGVWGASAGASAGIIAGLETPGIDAIVADSPYANLKIAASNYGKEREDKVMQIFFPFYMGIARFSLNFDVYGKTNLVERVKNLETPLFLVHGLEDRALGPINSQLIYENAGGPKRLWLVEGAWHVGAHEIYPEEYLRRVTSFFDNYLINDKGDRSE